METLMYLIATLLIVEVGTYTVSNIIEFRSISKIIKKLADKGLRMDYDYFFQLFDNSYYKLIPVVNILYQMNFLHEINKNPEMILKNIASIYDLIHFNFYEEEEYSKKTTILNAIVVPIKSKLKKNKVAPLYITNDEESYILHEYNKEEEKVEIFSAGSMFDNKSREEIEMYVYEMYYHVFNAIENENNNEFKEVDEGVVDIVINLENTDYNTKTEEEIKEYVRKRMKDKNI